MSCEFLILNTHHVKGLNQYLCGTTPTQEQGEETKSGHIGCKVRYRINYAGVYLPVQSELTYETSGKDLSFPTTFTVRVARAI